MSQPPTIGARAAQRNYTEQNLSDHVATVATEIGRTDNKASLLLAFNGAVIAGLLGAAGMQLPRLCLAVGGLAVMTLGASAVLLLLVVLPRLSGTDRASFPYWARCDSQQIHAEMRDDRRPERIRVLSQIVLRKYQDLQRAIYLSLAGAALIGIDVLVLIATSLTGR
ncbi:Pycsar system effector family protein [Streptomyces mirabilis]|uniref:Pycsar system effector family protein n=1 Tax=Streptomyces mirabilis TaxID=68239 RepID=UPI003321422C